MKKILIILIITLAGLGILTSCEKDTLVEPVITTTTTNYIEVNGTRYEIDSCNVDQEVDYYQIEHDSSRTDLYIYLYAGEYELSLDLLDWEKIQVGLYDFYTEANPYYNQNSAKLDYIDTSYNNGAGYFHPDSTYTNDYIGSLDLTELTEGTSISGKGSLVLDSTTVSYEFDVNITTYREFQDNIPN